MGLIFLKVWDQPVSAAYFESATGIHLTPLQPILVSFPDFLRLVLLLVQVLIRYLTIMSFSSHDYNIYQNWARQKQDI
jgi:hypothetical protein